MEGLFSIWDIRQNNKQDCEIKRRISDGGAKGPSVLPTLMGSDAKATWVDGGEDRRRAGGRSTNYFSG